MQNIKYNGQVGDILICQGQSWISKAIMKITRGSWSHTALYAEAWGRSGVVEAQKNGVNFKLWETWQTAWNYKYASFRFKGEFDKKLLMIKAFEKCGETKYDFFTFFRRAFGKRKKRSIEKEESKFICSEFTGWMWNIPGWFQMTPQEQFEYLSNHPDWELIYTSK